MLDRFSKCGVGWQLHHHIDALCWLWVAWSFLIDEHQNIVALTTVVTKELVQVVQPGEVLFCMSLDGTPFLFGLKGATGFTACCIH